MGNPIKGSDIYVDDGAIEKLINDLERTDEAFANLQATINKNAKKISDSVDNVTESTEEGREEMEKLEKQADNLRKAQEGLLEINDDNAKTILKLNDQTKSLNAVTKLQIQLSKQQAGSKKALQIQMKLNVQEIENLTEAGKANEKETQDLIKANEDLDKELRDLAKSQRANIKLTETQEKANKSAEGSYDQLAAQYELNKRALNAMGKEQRDTSVRGQELVQETADIREEMKRLQSETGNTTLEVGNYEESISDALSQQDFFGVSLDSLGSMMTTTTGLIGAGIAVVAGLGKAYASSARGANDLARANDRLDSIISGIGNSLADLTGGQSVLDKYLRTWIQIYGTEDALERTDRTVEIKEELRNLEVLEIENEALKKRQLQRAEIFRQIRDEERNDIELRKQSNIDLGKVIDKREETSLKFQDKRLVRLQKLLSFDKENLELQAAIKQVEFEKADIREEAEGFRSEQLINELALSREVNENQTTLIQEQIKGQILLTEEGSKAKFELEKKSLEETFELQLDAAGQNKQLQDIANQQYMNGLSELTLAYEKFQESQTELQAKEAEKRKKEEEKEAADEKKRLDQEAKEKLSIQQKIIEETLALRKSEIDLLKISEDEKTKLVLDAEKERLRQILELNKANAGLLSDLQAKTLENQISKIQNQIDKVGKGSEEKDLLSKFGLNISDEDKEAIKTSYDSATEIVEGYYDRRVEVANQAVDAANNEVDSAQQNLSNQIALSEQGFAANVGLAQREVTEAKKNQDKALKQQQEAQQAQQTLETIQQAGSLVTASAKIWSQLGFPLAIPAIGLMWGSFAAAKIKAAEVSKPKNFGDGGLEFLGGGTHASGNDTVIGFNNGYELRGEKNEALAVINSKNTAKYKDILPSVIDSLNKGVFEDNFMNGASGVSNINVGMDDMPQNIRRMANRSQTYKDGRGRVVQVRKNVKTIYS